MNHNEFKTVFDRQIEQSEEVLLRKSREYADDTDRLHNFKVAAGMVQGTPKQALWGFLAKHLTSLSDMVRSDDFYPTGVWDEKIGDAINYLILLRALEFEADGERTIGLNTELDPRLARMGDVHLNT